MDNTFLNGIGVSVPVTCAQNPEKRTKGGSLTFRPHPEPRRNHLRPKRIRLGSS